MTLQYQRKFRHSQKKANGSSTVIDAQAKGSGAADCSNGIQTRGSVISSSRLKIRCGIKAKWTTGPRSTRGKRFNQVSPTGVSVPLLLCRMMTVPAEMLIGEAGCGFMTQKTVGNGEINLPEQTVICNGSSSIEALGTKGKKRIGKKRKRRPSKFVTLNNVQQSSTSGIEAGSPCVITIESSGTSHSQGENDVLLPCQEQVEIVTDQGILLDAPETEKQNGQINGTRKRKRGRLHKLLVKGKKSSTSGISLSSTASVVGGTTGSVPDQDPILPFVKSSPLWKSIESHKILKKLPQKPHFRPLENQNEEFREGLAIGLMVTFFNLVEKVPNLQLDSPPSLFNSNLTVLLDLESHGFNVTALQLQITELLSIKDRHNELEGKSSEYESQISRRVNEKTQIY